MEETLSALGAEQAKSLIRQNPPRNMSVAEASTYIGVSERKLREQIALRSIKVVRIGKRIVIRCKDLEQFLDGLAN